MSDHFDGSRMVTVLAEDYQRLRETLTAINVDAWARLAHEHIADEGTVGTMARALATAIQLADDALAGAYRC